MPSVFVFSIYFLSAFFGSIRLLRWLSIVQQKEYRLDRIMAFLKTLVGIKEIFRILPTRSDFSRTGLKRPHFTPRIIFLAIFSIFLLGIHISVLTNSQQTITESLFMFLCIYVLIPTYILCASVTTSFISTAITYIELLKAHSKIKKNKPIIIGITGSYGKTSTKHILTHVLRQKYSVFTTPSSHNTKYSISKAINKLYKNEEIIVLEYAAYTKSEIRELCRWFKPTNAIITGLAPQHLELFGSIENIIQAKSDLIAALPNDGLVYYCDENIGAKQIVEAGIKKQKASIVPVSQKKLGITNVHLNPNTAQLSFDIERKKITTSLVGKHYLQAIMLSIAVAKEYKIDSVLAATSLETFKRTTNFISSYTLKTGALVIDDSGTANPSGVEAALEMIQEINPIQKKDVIMIFPGIVDLGPASDEIHQDLAELAFMVCYTVLYVGDIGKKQFEKHSFVQDNKEQIIDTLQRTRYNNIVLIEGRMPGWVNDEIKRLRKEDEIATN